MQGNRGVPCSLPEGSVASHGLCWYRGNVQFLKCASSSLGGVWWGCCAHCFVGSKAEGTAGVQVSGAEEGVPEGSSSQLGSGVQRAWAVWCWWLQWAVRVLWHPASLAQLLSPAWEGCVPLLPTELVCVCWASAAVWAPSLWGSAGSEGQNCSTVWATLHGMATAETSFSSEMAFLRLWDKHHLPVFFSLMFLPSVTSLCLVFCFFKLMPFPWF